MRDMLPRSLQTAIIFLVVAGILALALSGYLSPVSNFLSGSFVGAQTWLSTRFLAIQEFLTVPRDVAALRQENAQLTAEISRLQAQAIELQQRVSETDTLAALVDFSRSNPANTYKAASVIGRDPSPFLHYVIINRGSNDGIRRGMPVVTNQGLVGRVDAVIGGAARVQLITDPSSLVSVYLQNSSADAVLTGTVSGDVRLDMISQDAKVQAGDVVLTSGLGGGYPADLLVGQVSSVRKRESDLFQEALVQPVVDFTRLEIVLVIVNFRPVDIGPLVPTPIP
jgi:rod shape-determining protein MreC